jgi:hypothetical protein
VLGKSLVSTPRSRGRRDEHRRSADASPTRRRRVPMQRSTPASSRTIDARSTSPERADGVLTADEVRLTPTIASLQLDTGMIPWFPGGHCDPWNHVETAMALDVAGLHDEEAERAYEWLADVQRPDGSWHNYYWLRRQRWRTQARHQRLRLHRDRRLAPLALCTWDRGFVDDMWPTVERALDWVLDHAARRHVLWAVEVRRAPCRGTTRCSPARPASSTRCAAARLAGLAVEPPPRLGRGGRPCRPR